MLVNRLLSHAQVFGEKPAIISGDSICTYKTLADLVKKASRQLTITGVGKEDRVLLAAERTPEFAAAYLGCHAIGAIAVPLDPTSTPAHLEHIALSTTAKLALGLNVTNAPVASSYRSFLGSGSGETVDLTCSNVASSAIADLLFTTGTTGKPKGVMLTHGAILASARFISDFLLQTEDDIEVTPLPLAHSFGLGRLRCSIFKGSTIVLVDGFADPTAVIRAIRNTGATALSSVPAGLAVLFQMTGDAIGEFCEALRYIEIGSSAMDRTNKLRLMRVLPNTRICMHYGLTEASRSAYIEFHESCDKLESVGKPSPGVEIEVVDSNDLPLPTGGVGRVAVRSPAQMAGYWAGPESLSGNRGLSRVLTGDLGHFDEDGYLYLSGRESDVINIGGRKVSPDEIEGFLRAHPAIQDCVCVAMKDPVGVLGHVVKAFYVVDAEMPEPTPKDLAKFLRGKIEPFKMPRVFVRVDELPKTDSGKVRRQELAEV